MRPLEIPPPPLNGFYIGPLFIHFYAICILIGIFVAAWLSRKRFIARGGNGDQFDTVVFWMVILGIAGARLYHVITDYQLYFGPGRNPWQALNIRNGGLGIIGGVIVGALVAWLFTRRRGIDFGSFADIFVPGLLIAQGLGRIGNWFNQELFGRPTELPWALRVDPEYRPAGYEAYETFHPTFLYEMVWVFLGAAVLLWAERRFNLGRGKLFASYFIWYGFGRFFIEAVRIDPVNHIGGFRLNNYVALILFIAGIVALVMLHRNKPGRLAWPFGFPAPQGGLVPARPPVEPIAPDVPESGDQNVKTDT